MSDKEDADLEALLLQAAGRDDEEGGGRGRGEDGEGEGRKRKAESKGFGVYKGAMIPLKKLATKQFDKDETDDEESEEEEKEEEEEEEEDDELDEFEQDGESDEEDDEEDEEEELESEEELTGHAAREALYEDEEDRQRLMEMPEFQREEILAQRAEKRDEKRRQERIKRQLLMRQKKKDGTQTKKPERRKRGAGTVGSKQKEALKSLAKVRQRQGKKARGSDTEDEEVDAEKEDGEEDIDYDVGMEMGRDRRRERRGMQESADDHFDATSEEIKAVTLKRSQLELWHNEDFFDDSIIGCYVRVRKDPNLQVYSLNKIYDVVMGEVSYLISSNALEQKSRTNKCLIIAVNSKERSRAKPFQMNAVSDQAPDPSEIQLFLESVAIENEMPTRKEIKMLKAQLRQAQRFRYTAEHNRIAIERKREQGNIVATIEEVERIQRMLQKATEAEIRDERQIIQLENMLEQVKHAIAEKRKKAEKEKEVVRMQALNLRNRLRNVENDGSVATFGMAAKQACQETSNTLDPFSRRPTRPAGYSRKAAEKKVVAEGTEKLTEEKDVSKESKDGARAHLTLAALLDDMQKIRAVHATADFSFDVPKLEELHARGRSNGKIVDVNKLIRPRFPLGQEKENGKFEEHMSLEFYQEKVLKKLDEN